MVIRVPEMTINMTRLALMRCGWKFRNETFVSTSEERQREPIARFCTMAAFWISKEPWSSTMAQSWHSPQLHFTGMCISWMWMLMLRRCLYKSSNWIILGIYCSLKFKTHTHTGRLEKEEGREWMVRASSSFGLWREAEGRKILAVQYANGWMRV